VVESDWGCSFQKRRLPLPNRVGSPLWRVFGRRLATRRELLPDNFRVAGQARNEVKQCSVEMLCPAHGQGTGLPLRLYADEHGRSLGSGQVQHDRYGVQDGPGRK
jgi:hypothetical protein